MGHPDSPQLVQRLVQTRAVLSELVRNRLSRDPLSALTIVGG